MTTTWDPTTVANVTLSGGNLVVTNTGGSSGNQGARGANADGKTSGKYYFEITLTANGGGGNTGLGIGTITSTYTAMGNNATTGTELFMAGSIYTNGSNSGTSFVSLSGASVIGIAIDLDNRKAWFRHNGSFSPGLWNSNASNDPAINVGGITVPAGTMVPFCTFNAAGSVFTANFGASTFAGTVPSGFTSGWQDPSTGLSAVLVTDTDTFYVPVLQAGIVTLASTLYSEADAFYAAIVTPGAITLAPAAFSDADVFYAPSIANTTQFLQPAAIADADAIYAPSIVAQQIPGQALQPGLVAADDVIVTASVSGRNALQPALLIDPDDIPTVDAGWRLFGQLLVDVDLVLSPHVETLTFLLPNIFEDGETIDSYPFFIQAVSGGIPVPPPSGVLTGSISHKRLTGTLGHRPQLTGSLGQRPQLTGSLKRRAA